MKRNALKQATTRMLVLRVLTLHDQLTEEGILFILREQFKVYPIHKELESDLRHLTKAGRIRKNGVFWTMTEKMIFVFGSNRAGRHGKGAALHAKQFKGAKNGQGEGLQGSSYAIPTKDEHLQTLPLDQIQAHVDRFLEFARDHPDMVFEITRIGCGLAGYRDQDIAPMFENAPKNCQLPRGWTKK